VELNPLEFPMGVRPIPTGVSVYQYNFGAI